MLKKIKMRHTKNKKDGGSSAAGRCEPLSGDVVYDEKDEVREPMSTAERAMLDAPARFMDLSIDYMFTLGYRGVSLTEVADHYELSPREFRIFLSQNIDLYYYHAKGDTVRYNDYRRSVESVIKQKYIEKVIEGNVPCILYGMQNIVADRQQRLLVTLKEERPKPDLVEYAHLSEPERKEAVKQIAQALTQGLVE